jgi:hypothetical protein
MLIDGKQIPISLGMNVTAERRIIEFLLSSVQKMESESLRERSFNRRTFSHCRVKDYFYKFENPLMKKFLVQKGSQ